MSIHSLLRFVGIDVPEVITINGREVRETVSEGYRNTVGSLVTEAMANGISSNDHVVYGQGQEPLYSGSPESVIAWLKMHATETNALWVRPGTVKRLVNVWEYLREGTRHERKKPLTEEDIRRIFREELAKFFRENGFDHGEPV